MEITGYICCVLGLLFMISTTDGVAFQDKIDRQFFDSLPTEDAPKDKRPFCNAFTGCGKKRSFDSENTLGSLRESDKRIRILAPIYRALLRATSQEAREPLERDESPENVMSDLAIEYPAYLARKMQIRDGYQS